MKSVKHCACPSCEKARDSTRKLAELRAIFDSDESFYRDTNELNGPAITKIFQLLDISDPLEAA